MSTLQWPQPGRNPSPIARKDLGTYWKVKWAVIDMFKRMNKRQRRRDWETSPWIDHGGEA